MNKENLKLNLFRLKKVVEGSIAVDFSIDYNYVERKIIDLLESGIFRLKVASDERTDAIVNLIEENETSYPINFWKKEYEAKSMVFGLMLGLIDGYIDDKIKNRKDIIDFSYELSLRKNIESNYEKIFNSDEISILNSFRLKTEYLILCDQLTYNNPYVHYYKYGYKSIPHANLFDIYSVYNILFNELLKHISENKKYVKTISNNK